MPILRGIGTSVTVYSTITLYSILSGFSPSTLNSWIPYEAYPRALKSSRQSLINSSSGRCFSFKILSDLAVL